MSLNKKYFQIDVNSEERVADVNIYGVITSWRWYESDVSAYSFVKEIEGVDVDTINVYINSPGGEVSEALAIYSVLKRHSAKVNTFCDGFACSAASIIFCAGDNRIMGKIAMLMIHNCKSNPGYANSAKLRKTADDNDKINQSSVEAYKAVSNLSEDEIKKLMDAESWINADEAKLYGFATEIAGEDEASDSVIQSVQPLIYQCIRATQRGNVVISTDAFNEIKQSVEEIKHLVSDVKATIHNPVQQQIIDKPEENIFLKAINKFKKND